MISQAATLPRAAHLGERIGQSTFLCKYLKGRWPARGALSQLAAAVGLAPDVKFLRGKAQLWFWNLH